MSEGVDRPQARVVLDTNICLDLLLFDDPYIADLRAALQAGQVIAVTSSACREEWLRVLGYPQLRLDDFQRASLGHAFDALVQCLPDVAPAIALPRCADPDDQKFLRLAYDSGARWLLSRDTDVLALGRRTARAG